MTPSIQDNAHWIGDDLGKDQRWLHRLSDAEISDLQAMASQLRDSVRGNPNALLTMDRDAFDLGCFAERLGSVYDGLKFEQGIALIRGLLSAQMDLIDVGTNRGSEFRV